MKNKYKKVIKKYIKLASKQTDRIIILKDDYSVSIDDIPTDLSKIIFAIDNKYEIEWVYDYQIFDCKYNKIETSFNQYIKERCMSRTLNRTEYEIMIVYNAACKYKRENKENNIPSSNTDE